MQDNIRYLCDYWRTFAFLMDLDASEIDAQIVAKFMNWLKSVSLSDSAKAGHALYFSAFVKWLYRNEIIEHVPRNLEDVSWQINKKAVQIIPLDDVHKLLRSIKNDFHRLLAYLVLNTAANNGDIGTMLKKDVVGNIWTRKRAKRRNDPKAPIVSYRLWDETVELLNKFKSDHDGLFLLTSKNTPLYISNFAGDGDETHVKDMIGQQWYKAGYTLTLESLRKVPAQLLEESAEYSQFFDLMLSHAPAGTGRSHYAPESASRFLLACDWLKVKILPNED